VNNFTAIVPIWSAYSKSYNLRPINHVRLTGVAIKALDYHSMDYAVWHPDNCFSTEKWIEVRLYWCKWTMNQYDQLVIVSRHYLNGYLNREGYAANHPDHRFLVPAEQLQPLAAEELIYKSKEREEEEGKIYVQAWTEAHSNAIASSYY
jgi:hypothetical protein